MAATSPVSTSGTARTRRGSTRRDWRACFVLSIRGSVSYELVPNQTVVGYLSRSSSAREGTTRIADSADRALA